MPMQPHEKLKAIRAHLSVDGRKITQREMAVYFGTSQQHYCRLETGRYPLSVCDRLLIECMYRLMSAGLLRGVLSRFKLEMEVKG